MNIPERIEALRGLMATNGIDVYFIPSYDFHGTRYTADYWRSQRWISGFTGSGGIIIITADKAGLWVDSRYLIQALRQLDGSGIEVYDICVQGARAYYNFLTANLPAGGKLGFDGRVLSVSVFDQLKAALSEKEIMYSYSTDLIGELWHNRPPLPKWQAPRIQMVENKYTAHFLTAQGDVEQSPHREYSISGYPIP